jgi:nucleotide-binding universal stress UspA family protein
MSTAKAFKRDILIAVDDSENARRAVTYVGQMLEGLPDVRATLLHIIPLPEEDYFATDEERERWLRRHEERMAQLLEDYRQVLIGHGFAPENVDVRAYQRNCPSMATCILEERDHRAYGTIVVGRKGLSRSEEFLFGSISSKIVSYARNCTVWVVE